MTDPVERLVNLALFFASARTGATAARVRAEVVGYPGDQDDATFLRMFERDKDELRKMGFAISGDAEGVYHLDHAATFATAVDLNPAEAAAVRIAASALLDDPSFPFASDLRLALAKVTAEVDGSRAPATARLADENPAVQGELAGALSAAASARKTVAFDYTNVEGASAPHHVEPFGLFLHDGRWYLVGRDIRKDDVRTYTVGRMSDVSVNSAAPKTPDFERPADFDVSTFVSMPFQFGRASDEFIAELRFQPAFAWRAEVLARGTGELRAHTDGSVRWRVRARSSEHLLRYVIENGPGIEVVEPSHLVSALRNGLDRVVGSHG